MPEKQEKGNTESTAGAGHGGDIYRNRAELDYSVNINPLGMPREAEQAFLGSIGMLTCYPDPELGKFRRAAAEKYGLPPEEVLCGNGASELLAAAVAAVRPERVLLPVPSFSGYLHALRAFGTAAGKMPEIMRFPLRPEEDFAVTERILSTPRADLTILCTPNNPTGRTVSAGLLRRILEKCRRENGKLLLDACFLDLADAAAAGIGRDPESAAGSPDGAEGNMAAVCAFTRQYPELILVNALTKTYGMPGLRAGWLCSADPGLRARIRRLLPEWNVSVPASAAAAAALRCGEEYLKEAGAVIRTEREFLADALRSSGFTVWDSEANYILFRAERFPDLKERLLARGILIRACGNYEGLDETYFRIAVKRHEENRRLIRTIRDL